MDKLNKKCEVLILRDDGWECVWKSAKCIDQNGYFVRLSPYCKSIGKYDDELACWYDLEHPNYKYNWR